MVLLNRLILVALLLVALLAGCGPRDVTVELGGELVDPPADGFSETEDYDTLTLSKAGQRLLFHVGGRYSTLNRPDGTVERVHVNDPREAPRAEAPALVATMGRELAAFGWAPTPGSGGWAPRMSPEAIAGCFDAPVSNTLALPRLSHPAGASLTAFLDCRTPKEGPQFVRLRLWISPPE